MEPYPSGQFGFNDDSDRQLGNGSVWTRTRTQSESLEPLITLVIPSLTAGMFFKGQWLEYPPEYFVQQLLVCLLLLRKTEFLDWNR